MDMKGCPGRPLWELRWAAPEGGAPPGASPQPSKGLSYLGAHLVEGVERVVQGDAAHLAKARFLAHLAHFLFVEAQSAEARATIRQRGSEAVEHAEPVEEGAL